jgi:hypothetical protein
MARNRKVEVADDRNKIYPNTPQSIVNNLLYIELFTFCKFSEKLDWRAVRKRSTKPQQGAMNCSRIQEKRYWRCFRLNAYVVVALGLSCWTNVMIVEI